MQKSIDSKIRMGNFLEVTNQRLWSTVLQSNKRRMEVDEKG